MKDPGGHRCEAATPTTFRSSPRAAPAPLQRKATQAAPIVGFPHSWTTETLAASTNVCGIADGWRVLEALRLVKRVMLQLRDYWGGLMAMHCKLAFVFFQD